MPVKDEVDVETEELGEVLNGVAHIESSAGDTDALLNRVSDSCSFWLLGLVSFDWGGGLLCRDFSHMKKFEL